MRSDRKHLILALLLTFALLLSACGNQAVQPAAHEARLEENAAQPAAPLSSAGSNFGFEFFSGEWVAEDSGEILRIEADGTIRFRGLVGQALFDPETLLHGFGWVTPDGEYYRIGFIEYCRIDLGGFHFTGGRLEYYPPDLDDVPAELRDSLPAGGTVFRTANEDALYDLFVGDWTSNLSDTELTVGDVALTINADKSILFNGVAGQIIFLEYGDRLCVRWTSPEYAQEDPEQFSFGEFEYSDGFLYYTPYDISGLSFELVESLPNECFALVPAGQEP